MDVMKIAGTVLLSALAALILKKTGSPLYTAALCAGVVAAFSVCLPRITDIVDTAVSIAGDGALSDRFPIVLKAAAAALICDLASDICAGCEAPVLAKTVSTVGKFEILFISLPLFLELYGCAVSFVEGT